MSGSTSQQKGKRGENFALHTLMCYLYNMAYKHRRWTKEEDVKLKKLYNQKTLKKLAIIFDRTPNKVGRRAMKLGIKKDKKALRLEMNGG